MSSRLGFARRLVLALVSASVTGCAATSRTVARSTTFTFAPRHAAIVVLESTPSHRDVLCDRRTRVCVAGVSQRVHDALSIMLAYHAPRLGRGRYAARFAADAVTARVDIPTLTLWWRFDLRERARAPVLAIDGHSTVARSSEERGIDAAQQLADCVLERIRIGVRNSGM